MSTDTSFMTVPEIAKSLRVTQPTVRNWIEAGALPGYRFGSSLRVERVEFEAFIERSKVAAS
ncbi:helix-turn-helix domain-containing protein [Pimelobacter simplex]|uniref:Helix-turn-helix domain-containing protein n=1 Tax=Nocardioides simplex TaxID=2045 RepID=A0A7J5DVE3_NOCSI|nr:helix-turn-helix domain-containing protein [Pimelobacter simplex]KAB2809287.1 helix-turn-helix domain-containing protein [Pimelobacter simplex]